MTNETARNLFISHNTKELSRHIRGIKTGFLRVKMAIIKIPPKSSMMASAAKILLTTMAFYLPNNDNTPNEKCNIRSRRNCPSMYIFLFRN